jgi:hypothetical protein
LDTFPLDENITEHADKRKCICNGWNRLAFYNKPINVVRLVDETQEKVER